MYTTGPLPSACQTYKHTVTMAVTEKFPKKHGRGQSPLGIVQKTAFDHRNNFGSNSFTTTCHQVYTHPPPPLFSITTLTTCTVRSVVYTYPIVITMCALIAFSTHTSPYIHDSVHKEKGRKRNKYIHSPHP